MNTIEQAKQVLKDAGYFVDNLWHINDVRDKFKCDDRMAAEVLSSVLTGHYIMESINEQINYEGGEIGLEPHNT